MITKYIYFLLLNQFLYKTKLNLFNICLPVCFRTIKYLPELIILELNLILLLKYVY